METQSKTVCLQTGKKQELIDLTSLVDETIRTSGVRNGLVGVYTQHTTAALLVGECQSALVDDVLDFLTRIVDDNLNYKHNCPELSDCDRKNAASHLRGLLLNHSVMIPVMDGKPVLGQFQSILLAELDGPRERSIHIQLIGDRERVRNFVGRPSFSEDREQELSDSKGVRYLR